MELYLVKDKVKITEVTEAFSKTKDYNLYVNKLRNRNMAPRVGHKEHQSQEEDDRDRVLLKISDFPVALKSICSEEESQHSEKFAERVEKKLLKDDSDRFGNLNLGLIISDPNDQSPLDGYFLLTGLTDGSEIDILKRLKEFDNERGKDDLRFMIEVSLCHLPTASAACSPGPLMSLKTKGMDFRTHQHQVRNRDSVNVPREIKEWWERGCGFIFVKLSVKVTFNYDATDKVYGCSDVYRNLMVDRRLSDFEIRCKTGEVVKCHREVLAANFGVFQRNFEDILEIGKLETKMSKRGVKKFLEYVYCGHVNGGLVSSDLALELFRAGCDYYLFELEKAMVEIIMAKGSSDFKYFSVKGALDLFLYARRRDLKYFRDKAASVLRNYLKTAKDETLACQEYQNLLKDPELATELSTLYAQLK